MYRQEKISHILIEEISQIFLREIEFPKGFLVTVTKAEITNDLKEAKIFISIIPFEKDKQVSEILYRNIYHIQQLLNKKLRMKPVPKISFKIDQSIERADKMERLLFEN